MLSALATRANAVLDAVNTAGGAVMDTVNSNVSALAASAASAAKGASASAGPQPVAGQRSRPAGSALGGYYRGISLSQLMTEQLPPLQPSHLEPSHQKPPAHAPAASAAQTTQHASAADHPNRASLVVVPSNVANERVEFMVARLEDDDSEEEDEYDDGPALCKRESVMELRTYGAGIGGMAHAGTSDDEVGLKTRSQTSCLNRVNAISF